MSGETEKVKGKSEGTFRYGGSIFALFDTIVLMLGPLPYTTTGDILSIQESYNCGIKT